MDRKYLDDLARVVTRAGVLLLENGAEVYRVEDTMYHLCESYGCSTIDSYATPSLLIISFTLDGELSHNVKRVRMKSINLEKVDKVNDLSRRVTSEHMSLEDLSNELSLIEDKKPYSHKITILGAWLSSIGFAYAFGGGLMEQIYAGMVGIIIRSIVIFLSGTMMDGFFKNALCGFVLTALGVLGQSKGMYNGEIVISAVIMLLVPGLAITNAIRDSINGDLNSSVLRFIEAIFIAISIGLGSGIAYFLLRGVL